MHAHRRSDDTRLKTHGRDESIEDKEEKVVGEEGGGCLDVLQLPNNRQTH